MTLETRVDYDEEPRLFPTSQESSFVHTLIQNPTEKLRMAIIKLFTLKSQASENPEVIPSPQNEKQADEYRAWIENSQ